MIYFVVHNNYQRHDFELHLAELDRKDVTLVSIPHTLEACEYPGIAARFHYAPRFGQGALPWVLDYLRFARAIERDIRPAPGDVCFLYTEYELLNHYIAARFRKAGAKVYLVEDGGFPTYLVFRLIEAEAMSFKQALKEKVFRLLPGLSEMRFHRINGHVFRLMPDSTIDAVCLYRPVPLVRKVPTVLLRRPPEPALDSIRGCVIFLNEDVYNGQLDAEDYLRDLQALLSQLCRRFHEVLFKFHPRESGEWRARIRGRVLARLPAVKEVGNDAGIEDIVDRYRPSIAVSYLSAGLLNLLYRGVEPLYIYHLFPQLRGQPLYRESTAILESQGYNFVPGIEAIAPDYRSGLELGERAASATRLAELAGTR